MNPVSGLRRAVATGSEAGPALLGVLVFIWWAAAQGGFAIPSSFPGTVLVFGALLVLLFARPGRTPAASTPIRLTIGLVTLFGVLALVSSFGAESRGDAWDGAVRILLYAGCFSLFALSRLNGRSLAALLAVFAAGIAAVGVATVARAAGGTDLGSIFVDNRLSEPVGYVNASCALFLMAFLPTVVLASRRQLSPVARGALLAVAFCLFELAVLGQSRASLLALPVTIAVAFVVVQQRVRLLVTLALVAAMSLPTLPRLLAVYEAAGPGMLQTRVSAALWAIAIGSVAALLVGVALAHADRRIRIAPHVSRTADRSLGIAAGALAAGLVVVALVTVDDPVGRADAAWSEFNSGYPKSFEGSHFTGGLGDYRGDYWRVALEQFREEPLLGTGADNFAAAYVAERRFDNEARFPHSIPLTILASHGLAGIVLFLGFVGGALAAFHLRRGTTLRAQVSAAAMLVFVYWFVHGSVDWFWEIPGLAAPAFAFLGAAAGTARPQPRRAATFRGGRLLLVAVTVLALAAATPPWLAARQVEAGTTSWAQRPDAALDSLERASRLFPLSARADVIAGAIGNRSDRSGRAREALLRAVERNPGNWYAQFELAIAETTLGHPEQARIALARAAEVNPREETITIVRTAIAAGKPVDLRTIDAIFRERTTARTR